MTLDPLVLAAILGMAIATYATRATGVLLASRLGTTPLFQAWLGQVPGAMFVALVVPSVVKGGPAYWVGAVVAIALGRSGIGLLPSLLGSAAVVAGLRLALS